MNVRVEDIEQTEQKMLAHFKPLEDALAKEEKELERIDYLIEHAEKKIDALFNHPEA